jgi:hypothetical protein
MTYSRISILPFNIMYRMTLGSPIFLSDYTVNIFLEGLKDIRSVKFGFKQFKYFVNPI